MKNHEMNLIEIKDEFHDQDALLLEQELDELLAAFKTLPEYYIFENAENKTVDQRRKEMQDKLLNFSIGCYFLYDPLTPIEKTPNQRAISICFRNYNFKQKYSRYSIIIKNTPKGFLYNDHESLDKAIEKIQEDCIKEGKLPKEGMLLPAIKLDIPQVILNRPEYCPGGFTQAKEILKNKSVGSYMLFKSSEESNNDKNNTDTQVLVTLCTRGRKHRFKKVAICIREVAEDTYTFNKYSDFDTAVEDRRKLLTTKDGGYELEERDVLVACAVPKEIQTNDNCNVVPSAEKRKADTSDAEIMAKIGQFSPDVSPIPKRVKIIENNIIDLSQQSKPFVPG